jgi:hypothetical protein
MVHRKPWSVRKPFFQQQLRLQIHFTCYCRNNSCNCYTSCNKITAASWIRKLSPYLLGNCKRSDVRWDRIPSDSTKRHSRTAHQKRTTLPSYRCSSSLSVSSCPARVPRPRPPRSILRPPLLPLTPSSLSARAGPRSRNDNKHAPSGGP